MKNFVLILDFGSQYTKLIARRVRELNIYSEIHPYNTPEEKILELKPSAIILSGGPSSVYENNAPIISKKILNSGIPILGICYGLQLIAHLLGGKIASTKKREFGFAKLKILKKSPIFNGLKDGEQVWMSHGDEVIELPKGFDRIGSTDNTPNTVIENKKRRIYGVQFHPEVVHTKNGKQFLKNFLIKIAGIKPTWTMESFIEKSVNTIKEKVKDEKVLLGLSGGVDSSVAAVLLYKAIGKKLIPVFVDTGLLRKFEGRELIKEFKKLKIKIHTVKAPEIFFKRLKGITSPEKKRKIIGKTFIDIFYRESKKLGKIRFLAQGTTYPDVIESTSVKGPSAVIKSHHNVGGLPAKLKMDLIEPLRELFKDEVREVGKLLGLDEWFIKRHPFPGPGLAVRIIGEVNKRRVKILQDADYIVNEEVKKAGVYDNLWQSFAVLLPIKSVGVMGDKRTYENVCGVRMVISSDGMTASWYHASPELLNKIATRIVNEVKGINRVVYDITSKPPGTIEWE